MTAARPAVPEWLEALRGPCPACGGQGFHVEPDHDPGCDGERCSMLGCPVPVQVQCDCQGLLFSMIVAHPEWSSMQAQAAALRAILDEKVIAHPACGEWSARHAYANGFDADSWCEPTDLLSAVEWALEQIPEPEEES